ncbi:hypothetical protein NRB56_28870 [Nocardia sp. RB56]|uniref:Uncharacterized protein n=1 Tax=Nocardia aurantia TaxID=2585199 RepID=A0A7K0DR57_9NOCA|nr:hypothetical protein [Nocardia aurantia]
MPDEFKLPPPGLDISRVVHLDPFIDPRFVDAEDWGRYLTITETIPVDFEYLEPTITDQDVHEARELALASDNVRTALEGQRYEVLAVGSRTVDRETELPLVIVYNYTDDTVIEATVDLRAPEVREVSMKRYQPALSSAEQSRALDITRDDGRLSRSGIDIDTGLGLVVEDVNFRSPQYGHRLVDLRFTLTNRRCPSAFAIVDLSAQCIVGIGLLPQEELS